MANKKRMYKKGSFPGMEPYKMLTFGGMKKGKYEAAGPVARQMEEAKKAKAAAERIEAEEATKAAAAKRGPSRQEKQNTPQGTGGGAKPQVGSKLKELSNAPGPASTEPKPGTYAYAKKRNPNLDKLIAERKKYAKGTEDYNRVQNQINRAYGKGPMRKEISKVTPKSPPKNTAKPTIQKPASAKPAASKPASTPAAKKPTPTKTPSGGSGMGAVAKENALKNEINSAKPVDRRTSAPASSASTSVADLKSQIKDARKASKGQGQANRQAAKISRLEKRLAKLQGKKMEPGGLKPAPNKGAASLPKAVRNKMGFMKRGGQRY